MSKKVTREKTGVYGVGDRYKVRYVDHSGRERSKTFPDRQKKQADDYLREVEGELRRGTYIDPSAGKITFEEYATRWLRSQSFDESTRESTGLRLRLHVFPAIGPRNLDAIRPSDVRELLRALQEKGLAASYRQVIFIHMQTIFNAAIDDERIRKNPCNASSVQKPQIPARKVVLWPAERVHAVREAMNPRYRLTVVLGAGLGLRQGEAFGLAVDDVDFDDETVHVVRQVKLVGGKPCFGPPKGGKTRDVPLPQSVAAAIRAHIETYPPVAITLPWQKPGGEPTTVRLIVTSREHSAAWRPVYNQWTWIPALKKAGVERQARVDGFHALRHFYASTLLDAGETITALSSYLGHSDPGFTLKVYTHLMPSSKQRTRTAVDGVFGDGPDSLTA
ncbi:tyrosine-type recombinase/integrase [Actinophytocola algeriensis]|uniref:Integrase n=1 Tax=Actinophytocola algeriensis TaxID=1768010 RepID=A0A7W7VER8_9PSEU|nr:site-specific integrase [Actinophytocola algeriensis]MBB4907260.1 integrase [Actinophytocola algeriensis]MBE1478743.1 integrase [Actinophytocola algeriensis]